MSTMTLQLPMNYAEVEREEMEYVDGGMQFTTYWWGNAYKFTESETRDIVRKLGWGAGISTFAAEFGLPTAVAAVLGLGAVYVDWVDSLGGDKGITIKQNWVGYAWIDYNV